MKKAELLEKLNEWKYKLSYYDDAKPGEICPTPEGVKKYIKNLHKVIARKNQSYREGYNDGIKFINKEMRLFAKGKTNNFKRLDKW